MKKRETSQVLTKVFQALRSKGVRPGDVAEQLGMTVDEMNKMLFGLTMTVVDGGGDLTNRQVQGSPDARDLTATRPRMPAGTRGRPTRGRLGEGACP
ncbi:hypothetical protein ACIQMY_20205 [Streptomyces sp. NPDC091368]|uniref:hypothetical protein n=1 Tax=Streptomyces sp. NPDC091368 TaxID=3365993 RepID=UPI00382C948A